MTHDDDKVTTGEIYRRLCDIDERYEKKLDRIEDQVRKTNGRTTSLETQIHQHGRELGRLNSAVFPRPSNPNAPTPSSLPVVTPEGESLSIRISPKMWTLLASVVTAFSIFGPILADWVKRALGL